MTQPVATVDTITLPTWTDPTSIAAYLTTLVSGILGVLIYVHPGWAPPAGAVEAAIGAAALLISGGAQIVNIWRHSSTTKAAITAGATLALPASKVAMVMPRSVPSATPPTPGA